MTGRIHTLYPQPRDVAEREAARVALADRETEDAVADLRRMRKVGMGLADVIDRRAEQMMDVDHGKPLPIEAADGFETVALTVRRVIVLQQELLGLREPPQRRAPAAPRQPPVDRTAAEDRAEDESEDDGGPSPIDSLMSAFDSVESLLDSLDGGRDGDPAERDDLHEPDDLDDDRPIDDVMRDVRKAFATVANQLLPPDAAKALLDGMNFPAASAGAEPPDDRPSKPLPADCVHALTMNGSGNGAAAHPPGLSRAGGQGPPPG